MRPSGNGNSMGLCRPCYLVLRRKSVSLTCSKCGERHDAIPSVAKNYKTDLCRKCYDDGRKALRQRIECPQCGKVRWLSPAQAADCPNGYCRSCPGVYDTTVPDTYDAGYVFGAAMGDGYLQRGHPHGFGIRLDVTDLAFADRFADHLRKASGRKVWRGTRIAVRAASPLGFPEGQTLFYRVYLPSREWYGKLQPFKDGRKYEALFDLGPDFKAGFIQGILDAEGHVYPSGTVDLANKDRELLRLAAKFFADLGYEKAAHIYGPYPYSRGVAHLRIVRTGLKKTKTEAA